MTIARKPEAKFDPYQESVLSMIDDMFPTLGLLASRGHCTPQEQLHIIGAYSQGFQYPEFEPQDPHKTAEVEYEGKHIIKPAWWRTWGECLHRGIVVNPPFAEVVPFDYFKNGVNQKGVMKHASNHEVLIEADPAKTPCPIDFSQRMSDRPKVEPVEKWKPNIERVAACMEQAKASGVPIENITIEHGNGCVHLDLKKKGASA